MGKNDLLITGGAGFIGGHLVRRLLEKGYSNITVVDLNKPSISGINYIYGDFANEKLMKQLLKKTYALFHLAAVIGVDNCTNNPQLVEQINLINTMKLIDLSADLGVKRIIFTSSSEVYGNSKNLPYNENSKLEPFSLYGYAKVKIEEHLKKIHKNYHISVGIVRPFNIYGPRQAQKFVIPIFIDKVINNENIQIFGNGRQTRTFTYVDDGIDGIVKLFEYKNLKFEIVNIGSIQEYSINDVANLIVAFLPESESKIKYVKYGSKGVREFKYEINRRLPNIQKAKSLLDFEPKTTLTQGLRETIDYSLKN